ncbi:MAG: hypothetical protein GYB66_05025 [Chloroflexi bacterium]|nr:hypothetical protein [Chloroflexota bacterium]
MTTTRPNFVWPVIIIGVGIIMLMINADVIPEAYGDLLIRSWPVLMMMFGLNVLLAGRLRYANWAVLGLSIILVVMIARLAYARQSEEYRDDYREFWQDYLPIEVDTLVVEIDVNETRTTISNAPDARQVQAEFVGSTESNVDIDMEIQDNTATLRISESRTGILPRLAEVGRGTLTVFLPWAVEIDELNYTGDDGPATFDFTAMAIRWVDVDIGRGNVRLCLPADTTQTVVIGNIIRLGNGDLRMHVPDDTALKLNLGNTDNQPRYEPPARENDYVFEVGGDLETRVVVNNQFDVLLDIDVDGTFTLDHTATCQ